jgi:hypothetical protein
MNKKMLSFCAVSFMALLAAMPGMAQSGYFTAITNLNPAGYWPMHEVEVPGVGDIETNYGSLGPLGTAFYPDWATANGHIIQRQAPGALVDDNDTAVHFTQTKISGTAVSFTNGLFIPHVSPLTTLNPQFSVECWFYPSNISTGVDIWAQNGEEGLNAGPESGVTGYICGIRLVWVNATFVVYGFDNQLNTPTENSNKLATETIAQPTNQWYHLVVTCDPHTNIALFINGTLAASGTDAGKYSPDYWTPLSIGSGLGGTRSIAGSLDEFAVYTNALTQTDIQNHYNAALDPTDYGAYETNVLADDPIIYLRMDGPLYTPPPIASWPVLTNFGSVAVNGVYTPGTLPGLLPGPDWMGGPFAGLASATTVPELSGVSSFADAGYASSYNPTGPAPFSVAAMFRGNPADNRLQTIVGHSTNSWAINLTTLGKLECQLGTNTTSQVTSAGIYNDGNWHQVVEVYTPGSEPAAPGTNALYVDGALDTSVVTVTTNGILPGTNLDVMLGSDPQFTNNPAGVGRQFAGQVCEVALFTNALTAAQVRTLYNFSGVPPIITQQPASGSVDLNGAFTNTVVAIGSIAGYQWYKNDIAIPDQTNASLILNPALAANNSADYYVVVSNSYTSVTSAVVSLTVNAGAAIAAQTPSNVEVFAGSSPTLFMDAVGTGTLQFQWTSNGNVISGATGSSYTVVNPQSAATYIGTVANAYGTNSTSPITLNVVPDPTAPYPVAVLASHPMDYWRLNEPSGNTVGYDYTGGNNGIYTNANLGYPGYTSQFNPQSDPTETAAAFGYSTANDSYLGMVPTIVNFGDPANTSAEFSVEAWIHPNSGVPDGAGLVSLGYGNGGEQFCLDLTTVNNYLNFFVRDAGGTAFDAQSSFAPTDGGWHHVVGVCDEANGFLYLYADGQLVASTNISAGTGLLASTNSLVIGSRQEGFGTQFDDQITGTMNDVAIYNYAMTSGAVQTHYLAAGIAPNNIQVQPPSQNADVGSTVTFTGIATATGPLFYFWTDQNNTLVSTNPVLTLTDVQPGAYSYVLQVTNLYGQASSASATLNVYSGPVALYSDISPLLQQVTPGNPVTLTAGIYGTPPISYQWFINTTNPIPGATNSTYSFLASPGTNTYTLFATNEGGVGISSSSTATVIGSASIGFGNTTEWDLNGGATLTGSPPLLELTDGNLNEARSAFYKIPQNIDGFIATFTYTPAQGGTSLMADGATFTLQNSPSGASARGLDGGELAYGGITPSVAFSVDLFANSPGGPGINWETNGLTSQDGGVPNGGAGPVSINNFDPINVSLYYDYSAGQLDVNLADTNNGASYYTNYTVGNLSALLGANLAYVGFTGSTGGDDAVQTISGFTYSYTSIPMLSVSRAANGSVVISWPETISSSFVLQQSETLTGPWSNVETEPTPNPASPQYQVSISPSVSAQFYRLILPNP